MTEIEDEALVKELDDIEEMRPILKKYWKARAEALKGEQFYKLVLYLKNL